MQQVWHSPCSAQRSDPHVENMWLIIVLKVSSGSGGIYNHSHSTRTACIQKMKNINWKLRRCNLHALLDKDTVNQWLKWNHKLSERGIIVVDSLNVKNNYLLVLFSRAGIFSKVQRSSASLYYSNWANRYVQGERLHVLPITDPWSIRHNSDTAYWLGEQEWLLAVLTWSLTLSWWPMMVEAWCGYFCFRCSRKASRLRSTLCGCIASTSPALRGPPTV